MKYTNMILPAILCFLIGCQPNVRTEIECDTFFIAYKDLNLASHFGTDSVSIDEITTGFPMNSVHVCLEQGFRGEKLKFTTAQDTAEFEFTTDNRFGLAKCFDLSILTGSDTLNLILGGRKAVSLQINTKQRFVRIYKLKPGQWSFIVQNIPPMYM